ncbi:MAG: radical SAM/SPASM domain-containing protein [bacterium]
MFKVSKKISFQFYKDFCIILNHADSSDYKLNLSGSSIFKKIADGISDFSQEELLFVEELVSVGIVEKEGKLIQLQNLEEQKGIESSVWEELLEYGEKNLVPISGVIELTYDCPLSCLHCYINKLEVKANERLHFDEYAKFIDEFKKLGGLYLVFTGGDPLLHEDFEKIFNYAREKNIAVSIMSSGWTNDFELLKRTSKKGIVSFQASLHGHNSEIHDKFTRKKGSFDSVMKVLRFLKKEGVFVQAAVPVTTENILFFDEICSFLKNEKIVHVFNYDIFEKRNGDKSPLKFNVSREQIKECYKKTAFFSKSRLAEKKEDDSPCSAARAQFSLNPSGVLFPCLEIRIPAGNIKEKSFEELWKNAPFFNEIRALKFKDLFECPKCDAKNFCDRCVGKSLREGLDLTGHSLTDCLFAALKKELSEQS